jgi:C-terminal processing protease CtpA/Prc
MNELITAMKKNVGGFVFHPSMGHAGIVKKDTIYRYPKRVGIIINESNASSAEQFILDAKESKKVTLFGISNTAGVLDYSNRVQEDLPSGKYEFYWPLTRSGRLPEHPIDNVGIPPDVIIPYPERYQLFDRIDDWVYFVKEYLENKD